MDEHTIGVATNIALLSLLALSAYVLLLVGELSFGQQGFFAVGAYTAGIATAMFEVALPVGAGLAIVAGASLACLVGLVTTRLSGMYFAMATLAMAEALRVGFEVFRWQLTIEGDLVGPDGAHGFRGIRWILENGVDALGYLTLVWCTLLGLLLVIMLFERSRIGAIVRAVGYDPELARSVGIDVRRVKLSVIGASGGLAALGGALFAHHNTYIEPRNFDIMLGVHTLAYPLIGGLGTALGPLIGVIFDIGLLEGSRWLGEYRMIIFGGLVAILLWVRPRGLLDEHAMRFLWR